MTYDLREALRNIRTAIIEAPEDILTDTFWMPENILKNGTVVDYIDIALGTPAGDVIEEMREAIRGVRILANAGVLKDFEEEPWLKRIQSIDLDQPAAAPATAIEWRDIEMAKDLPDIWRKDNGAYKTSISVLLKRPDGQIKVSTLMWVYNAVDPANNRIGLFADDFRPTQFAILEGLK